MSTSAEQADSILDSTYERGNITLSVGSRVRKRKLRRLLQTASTDSISGDVFQAIDYYLKDKFEEREDEPDLQDERDKLTEKRELATNPKYLGRE